MKQFKYSFFVFVFLFPLMFFSLMNVMGQTSPPLIKLSDQPFRCEGCKQQSPKETRATLNQRISRETSIYAAREMTSVYFTYEGDIFSVVCNSCSPKVLIYANEAPAPQKPRGFITPMGAGRRTGYKGSEHFNTWQQLIEFMTDSVLVIDSLTLSVSNIIGKDDKVFSSLRATYRWQGARIEKKIPYFPAKEAFILTRSSLFDNQLPFSVTDTLSVSIHYTSSDNEKITVPQLMKVYFANPQEKKELLLLVQTYKKEFPDWDNEAIADELLIPILCKYKNASVSNLIAWLQSVR